MKLTVTLELDNDAFQPDWQEHASELLQAASRKVLTQIDKTSPRCPLIDRNGNTVGQIKFTDGRYRQTQS